MSIFPKFLSSKEEPTVLAASHLFLHNANTTKDCMEIINFDIHNIANTATTSVKLFSSDDNLILVYMNVFKL